MTDLAFEALCKFGAGDAARTALDHWLETLDPQQFEQLPLKSVTLFLAKKSPDQAAEWLGSIPQSKKRDAAMEALGSEWLNHDPAEAMEWAVQLDESAAPGTARNTFSDWCGLDQRSAMEWLSAYLANPVGPNSTADQMIATAIRSSTIRQTEPAAAMQWAEAISDPALRLKSIEQIVRTWNRTNSPAALRYVSETRTLIPEEKRAVLNALNASAGDDDF